MSLDIWLTIEVDTGGDKPYTIQLYDTNMTHNVIPMWSKAGVYDALYNSEGKQASEILESLKAGVADMTSNPEDYKELNPDNGWGSYESALYWLKQFTQACNSHPKAVIGLWA